MISAPDTSARSSCCAHRCTRLVESQIAASFRRVLHYVPGNAIPTTIDLPERRGECVRLGAWARNRLERRLVRRRHSELSHSGISHGYRVLFKGSSFVVARSRSVRSLPHRYSERQRCLRQRSEATPARPRRSPGPTKPAAQVRAEGHDGGLVEAYRCDIDLDKCNAAYDALAASSRPRSSSCSPTWRRSIRPARRRGS